MKLPRAALLAVSICLLVGIFPGQGGAAAPQIAPGDAGALEFKGHVQPAMHAELSPMQSGSVQSALVQRGERVAAGQVLVVMEGAEQAEAQVAAARLEILAAERELRDLDRRWLVERAQLQAELAQLNRQAALARDRLDGLLALPGSERLAQARANLLLASRQLEKAQDELRKAQQKFNNRKSLIWYFVNRRTFRLQLALLEGAAVQAQRRYDEAAEKMADLLAPPDPVDAAIARADSEKAEAQIADTLRRIDELGAGPDPDAAAQAEARLLSAQAAQRAAQEALDALRLKAPFAGLAVEVLVEAGEWLSAGQSAVRLADTSAWVVEVDKLGEKAAAELQPGAQVAVRLDAYPQIELSGRIKQIDLAFREEDGDVYFPLQVEVLGTDPRLRWGLTARIQTNP